MCCVPQFTQQTRTNQRPYTALPGSTAQHIYNFFNDDNIEKLLFTSSVEGGIGAGIGWGAGWLWLAGKVNRQPSPVDRLPPCSSCSQFGKNKLVNIISES
jgi:hypothetical protein